jgi:RHS repeat-associated protein
VPLGGQQLFVRVRLDGRAPVMHDAAGWSHWGTHQPATNNQLHFAVEPATAGDADRVPVNAYATHTYTYDAAGQLREKHGADGSVVCYSYDAARNMVQCHGDGFTNRYQYDYLRRLNRQVHEGADGITSNSFVYDGLDMIAKIDEISGDIVCFTRGLGIAPGVGDVLAETHILGASTQSFFYITNHRGDTVALVDESGNVVGTYAYDAWGNITSHTGADAYFTFSSKHYDENAGLYYYGFRWYDPQSKRWTQPDPEGLSEGLDLYQFCGNDPVNNVDICGCAWIDIVFRHIEAFLPRASSVRAATAYWTDISVGGYQRGGTGGELQAFLGDVMNMFIGMWNAEKIEESAQRAGDYSAIEGCAINAWKSAGMVGWYTLENYLQFGTLGSLSSKEALMMLKMELTEFGAYQAYARTIPTESYVQLSKTFGDDALGYGRYLLNYPKMADFPTRWAQLWMYRKTIWKGLTPLGRASVNVGAQTSKTLYDRQHRAAVSLLF